MGIHSHEGRRRRDWTDRRGQGLELIMWEFTSKDCFSFYSEVDFDEVLFLGRSVLLRSVTDEREKVV